MKNLSHIRIQAAISNHPSRNQLINFFMIVRDLTNTMKNITNSIVAATLTSQHRLPLSIRMVLLVNDPYGATHYPNTIAEIETYIEILLPKL